MDFSLAHIHGRVYGLVGRKTDKTGLPDSFHLDRIVLREDLAGWDVVPDLVFEPYFFQYAVIPYNI